MPRSQLPFSIEYVLMGLLYQGPMHGYDLYKELSSLQAISMIWRVKQSQLYALLDKLEKEGYLSSERIPGETHPTRRQFQLTPRGQEALAAWVSTPVRHARDMRQDFLARFYFASQTGLISSTQLLDQQRAACLDWLCDLEARQRQLDPGQCFEKIVLGFRLAEVKAMVAWLEDCYKEFVA